MSVNATPYITWLGSCLCPPPTCNPLGLHLIERLRQTHGGLERLGEAGCVCVCVCVSRWLWAGVWWYMCIPICIHVRFKRVWQKSSEKFRMTSANLPKTRTTMPNIEFLTQKIKTKSSAFRTFPFEAPLSGAASWIFSKSLQLDS